MILLIILLVLGVILIAGNASAYRVIDPWLLFVILVMILLVLWITGALN